MSPAGLGERRGCHRLQDSFESEVQVGVARQLVKRSADVVDFVARPSAGVTILIYHRVGGRTPTEVDLPRELFDEQMAYLQQHHRVISLDDALVELSTKPVPGDSPVVLSFDDGTSDFADEAMPVIARHRVPVTLYVATRFVEDQVMFPDDGKPVSWAGLADAVSTGLVTIGSHTHTHALLDRAELLAVRDELDTSIDLIGERLGVRAEHFAYPKAVPGPPSVDLEVRKRFRSAALARTRRNRFGTTDPYRLWRSPIQVSDGMQWFRRKANGGMRAEDTLRRGINRYRYRKKSS